jgi:hypothetical protein
MKDKLHARHCLGEGLRIEDRAADEFDFLSDTLNIGRVSRREIVKHANFVAALHERLHEMRTYKAATAGNKAFRHGKTPPNGVAEDTIGSPPLGRIAVEAADWLNLRPRGHGSR